jgi:hypothetical protein
LDLLDALERLEAHRSSLATALVLRDLCQLDYNEIAEQRAQPRVSATISPVTAVRAVASASRNPCMALRLRIAAGETARGRSLSGPGRLVTVMTVTFLGSSGSGGVPETASA